MKKILLAIFLLSLATLTSLSADEQIHARGQVAIWIPDDWKVQNDTYVLLATQPDGDMLLFYYILEAEDLEAAVAEFETVMTRYITGLEARGETDDIILNGLTGVYLESEGDLGKMPVDLAVFLLNTPNDKIMMVTAIVRNDKLEEYNGTLEKIFAGIKPLGIVKVVPEEGEKQDEE